mmetsp:Transcript_997/g.1417  ORF Transcript_997/g.1417 Transcript_997/m.1417 type:complete len:136 (-) Transcript_997:1258-1665(-)
MAEIKNDFAKRNQHVIITTPALHVLLCHAYTTESEEIIGLLLGDVVDYQNGYTCSRIFHVRPQMRVDRRHDRVEVEDQSLVNCQVEASHHQAATGRECRVVGWYHSHPKLAVTPSVVDLRYQVKAANCTPKSMIH